jgi:Domain of unknown function (DUF4902)
MLPTLCPDTEPTLSFDGYVRLTFDVLTRLAFKRKSAWEDAELGREFCAESLPARRAGYCEWETDDDIAVTVGWTWFAIDSGRMFIAPGCVNSNLMLVTQKNYDLGALKTSDLLRAWLSSVSWQPEHILKQF